ncbi:MAG: 2OG-Fe(II) oxygenase [Tolypothrix sp. Co-bin9]|nr:2OG-Fe(II) oxygenase [Tolypothrix sp. Co-bin9]
MLQHVLNLILREMFLLPVFRIPSERAYERAKDKYSSDLPVISSNDLACIKALKEEGVFVTSLEALGIPSTPQLLWAANNLLPQLTVIYPHNKEIFIEATPDQILSYPNIFLWGLEERLIDIAERYIGLPVFYQGSFFRRDLANGIQRKSRLWHMDHEDRPMIKILIYLNDVNEDGGAFQYIPLDLSKLSSQILKYKHSTIQDEVIESVISTSYWKSCLGSAGTVIFADTGSIFHRASIPIMSERFSITFSYTSRYPKNPHYCKSFLSKNDLLSLAKKLSPRQRKCILWEWKPTDTFLPKG